jgi:adenine/guanine phosphoribosyltransferase-like PRPP-binding protein
MSDTEKRAPCRIVSEDEFAETFKAALDAVDLSEVGSVTGPGRSGAVAAVYASHYLAVPFIPYGAPAPAHLGRVLVVDTAVQSGRTLRKAVRAYEYAGAIPVFAYQEPPRVAFWYEAPKPQRYRHERIAA